MPSEYFIYCHYFVPRAVYDIHVGGVTRYMYMNATE